MKPVRCFWGLHKWDEWKEVGEHLERKCLRCEAVRVKYPDVYTIITKCICKIAKYYLTKKKEGN